MGSVKDTSISIAPSENESGIGTFDFSDRYSVFDWGEMPDHIKNKGRALCVMGASNFEGLEKRGIKTHYVAMVDTERFILRKFPDLKQGENGSNVMEFKAAMVYKPVARRFQRQDRVEVVHDYSFFNANRGNLNNFLVGLEIIFRNGLPLGSSVFDRIAEAKAIEDSESRQATLQAIYEKYGLTSEPKPGDMLPKPVVGFTTKLEAGDRKLTRDEAYEISGLTQEKFEELEPLALRVNDFISEQAQKAGMVHWDGKVEMVYRNGELIICDVTGTFDEDRFSFNREQVSKEVLRQWYKTNQLEFAPACKKWKKTGEGWQDRCPVKPVYLPPQLSTLASRMYMSGCNRYVGRRIFSAPELEAVMERIRPFRGEN